MPFKSAKQELAMRKNAPATWRQWVELYGHHPGYSSLIKKMSRSKKRRSRRKRVNKRFGRSG